MTKLFLAQSLLVQWGILIAHAILVFLVAFACMRWLGARARGRSDLIPVGPYFVSVTAIYALFLAFHASTLWSRQHAAEADFRDAVTALGRLDSLFGKEGLALDGARAHLSRYVEAVVRNEWANANAIPSPQASQALEDLRRELLRASEQVPTALGNHLWRLFDDVVRARSERLWIGARGRSEDSWALVLLLGLLSHIAIGVVHADRPRAGALALALFACTTTAAYWLLVRAVDPFASLDTMQYIRAVSGK